MFSQLGLTNTPWAVIIPSLISPFGLYLIWVYAAEAVPTELLEAARIDGAGEFRTFFTISLRLLAPGIVTVLLFTVVATWNNYFLPLIMLSDPAWYPLTVGLNQWNAQATGVGGAADLQPRDHRLAAHDHPDRRRLPAPAAVLAVGPERRKRQAVLERHACEYAPLSPGASCAGTVYNEVKGHSMTHHAHAAPRTRRCAQRHRRRRSRSAPRLAGCSADAGGGGRRRRLIRLVDAALEKGGDAHVLDAGPPRPRPRSRPSRRRTRRSTSTLVNAGTGNDEYTKLQNAIKAGSGAPDVAQIEYYALPQFALSRLARRPLAVRLRRPRGRLHARPPGAR